MKKWYLEEELRDKAMRKEVLKLLQEATKDHRTPAPDWPEVTRDDDGVKTELKRILGFRW